MWPFKSVNGISQERKRVKTEVKVLTSEAAGGHRPWSALLLLKEKRKEKNTRKTAENELNWFSVSYSVCVRILWLKWGGPVSQNCHHIPAHTNTQIQTNTEWWEMFRARPHTHTHTRTMLQGFRRPGTPGGPLSGTHRSPHVSTSLIIKPCVWRSTSFQLFLNSLN